jgi:hypothetical protein
MPSGQIGARPRACAEATLTTRATGLQRISRVSSPRRLCRRSSRANKPSFRRPALRWAAALRLRFRPISRVKGIAVRPREARPQ